MKVKVNLSNQTLEYMDSQPYIQGTDTRNKLSVYIKHSTVPQTEGSFNIMIAYALQNGRTTIKMANTGATQETIDDVLYDIFYFTAPKVLTSISGNFVATLILKVESNTYKVNVLNTVLNAVDFEAFEDALDDTASEVLESLESMAEDITYLQSQVVGVLHNTDIVDNDTSNDPTKVLSARMGKVLAERIGATTSGLVSATYNESTGVLTLTYENDDTYEMKIGLSATDKSNMADDVENVILADLFETFSIVKSYSTGDFVNYENNIYEFVSDKSSGAWDSTKVVIANLNDYMEEVNTSLANMTETITGLGDLQPQGTDTSTNILAFNENKGIYIGTDTGCWYYWDASDSEYKAGGTYQASQLVSLINCRIIPPYANYINYNTTNNTIEIPIYTMLLKNDGTKYENSSALSITIPSGTSAMVMIFNWTSHEYSIIPYTSLTSYTNSNYSIVLTIRTTTHQLGCECVYTIDNKVFGLPFKTATNQLGSSNDTPIAQDIVTKKFNQNMLDIFFYPNAYPTITSSPRKITFPSGTRFYGFDFNYALTSDVEVNLFSVSSTSVNIILIDTITKEISCVAYGNITNATFVDKRYIGTIIIQANNQWSVRIACPYYYNGVLYGATLPTQSTNGSYYGTSFPSKVNKFYYENYMTISYDLSYTSQDIDVYNGILYVALNPNKLRLYNLSTKALITELSVDISHANSMQFSKTFYDENDTIPLLYCGYENYVSIIRITESGGTYSATLLYKLKFTNIGNYASPYFDFENGVMWQMGYKYGYDYSDNNNMIISMFNLNNLIDNGDDTYTPELLTTNTCQYVGTTQGRKFYNGKLYMVCAQTYSPYKPKLLCLDAYTGAVETIITDGVSTMSELEGVCFYIDNNDIYWLVSDYFNFKKIKF